MRAGYRKFFMFGQVAILIGIGYLMTRFWEEAKNQCELYNLPQKLWVILGMMFICGIVSWRSVDALTRIYIHKWGMELAFLGYKKKIVWEDFSVIQRYKNHFFFNVSKQKDSGLFFSTYHPFTSFVIFDKSEFSCVRTMPISADEFCELLTSYGVEYAESK